MRTIKCDICGIKIGSNLERMDVVSYGIDPGFSQFTKDKYEDICNNCENELKEGLHKIIEKLEKK